MICLRKVMLCKIVFDNNKAMKLSYLDKLMALLMYLIIKQ